MELQYLIESKEKAEQCLSLKRDKEISSASYKLDEVHFIIIFRVKSNDRKAAYKLSDLNDMVEGQIDPTVLINGSAAYFNKILYPLVNDFERKLRKFLYIASAIKPSGENVISDLEKKDFGTIFDFLFLDKNYLSTVREFVNQGNKKNNSDEKVWRGYAFELTEFLNKIKESPFWDNELPGRVPTLRKSFAEIKLRRNDVMHAHNIGRQIFTNTETLFKKVNNELDQAIEDISSNKAISETFNQSLANIITIEATFSETITAEVTAEVQ